MVVCLQAYVSLHVRVWGRVLKVHDMHCGPKPKKLKILGKLVVQQDEIVYQTMPQVKELHALI